MEVIKNEHLLNSKSIFKNWNDLLFTSHWWLTFKQKPFFPHNSKKNIEHEKNLHMIHIQDMILMMIWCCDNCKLIYCLEIHILSIMLLFMYLHLMHRPQCPHQPPCHTNCSHTTFCLNSCDKLTAFIITVDIDGHTLLVQLNNKQKHIVLNMI